MVVRRYTIKFSKILNILINILLNYTFKLSLLILE